VGEADGVFLLDGGGPLPQLVERALAWEDADSTRFRGENSWAYRLKQAGLFESMGG